VAALAITPDGRTLASGGYDRLVRLWRLPTGEPLGKLEGHTGDVTSLALSPDGRVLASGGYDHDVRLWALPDGRLLRRLHEPTGAVSCVAISADGRLLATGGTDRALRLWNLLPLRLAHVPVAQTSLRDLAWVDEILKEEALALTERAALEFVRALIRGRMRFEIEVGEAPRHVSVGEFDIEIVA
jgi:WD40 repeat protein